MDEDVFERWQAKRQNRKRSTNFLPLVFIALLVVALAAPVSSALLAGPAETRPFAFTNFDSVRVSDGVTVKLAQGPFAVTATGPGGDIDKLELRLDGSTLVISRKPSVGFIHISFSELTVNVAAPAFASITATEGGEARGEALQLTDVKLNASSGGDIRLKGACVSLVAVAGSGGDVDTEELVCQRADARAASGAALAVHATEQVTANAASGGEVAVFGKPKILTQDATSGGDVDIR